MSSQREPSNSLQPGAESFRTRLNRSPHPYHRRSQDLPEPTFSVGRSSSLREHVISSPTSPRGETNATIPTTLARNPPLGDPIISSPTDYFHGGAPRLRGPQLASPSESGTEADDEKPVLKALTAPPLRLRKGLRDTASPGLTDVVSPLPTPSLGEESYGSEAPASAASRGKEAGRHTRGATRKPARQQVSKRGALYARRAAEILLQGALVALTALKLPRNLRTQVYAHLVVVQLVYAGYLLRVARRGRRGKSAKRWSLRFRSSVEVAPFLYPMLVPILVALLLPNRAALAEANFVLSLCAIPLQIVPFQDVQIHWLLSFLPQAYEWLSISISSASPTEAPRLDAEVVALVLPLHYSLVTCLEFLTTTSLLSTEVQLLSAGLINLLLFANSPQAYILKALIWIGGIALFCTCKQIMQWTVSLARVPNWRYRKVRRTVFRNNHILAAIDDTLGGWLSSTLSRQAKDDSDSESEHAFQAKIAEFRSRSNHIVNRADTIDFPPLPAEPEARRTSVDDIAHRQGFVASTSPRRGRGHSRRHTLPTAPSALPDIPQLRRTATKGLARFRDQPKHYLSLTSAQATLLKWLYAAFVYTVVALTVLVPIRVYIGRRALNGHEPFGWALGYLLGDLPAFRMQVILLQLDNWICLPPHHNFTGEALGLVEHYRTYVLGVANTRLWICAYCLAVIGVGLAIVLHLSSVAEVDTRRKVFHGMMVAMFGVTSFIDPSLISLAFVLILAIFLLLDLFRAAQLPPLAKPLTLFLAPYVDGRDFKGPVIVSHLFLLTGCAVPFWLALAALDTAGEGAFVGWEVPAREVSMVAGVVCVGLGDAAASLIGRRYGRRRWAWGGGKSLEGSLAFAGAVTAGLLVARLYLYIGGWPVAQSDSLMAAGGKIVVAACAASLTEAVLTGANDNVLVPVVLWLWVKALDL